MSGEQSDAQFIATELNSLARENYLASLFVPDEFRGDIQTLLCFSAEVSTVRQRVSEPMPGEIRLQWWHDVIEGKRDDEARANPLAASLLRIISKHNLPKVPLLRLVAAHRFDLYDDPMTSVNQFEGYAGETRAAIIQFAAMILASSADQQVGELAEAAGHLGVALCYLEKLKQFERDAANGQIFLPFSVFESFGLSDGQVLARENSTELNAAMTAHLEAAKSHLEKAENAIANTSKEMKPAFVRLAFLRKQIAKMQRATDAFYLSYVDIADWQKIWTGFWFVAKN